MRATREDLSRCRQPISFRLPLTLRAAGGGGGTSGQAHRRTEDRVAVDALESTHAHLGWMRYGFETIDEPSDVSPDTAVDLSAVARALGAAVDLVPGVFENLDVVGPEYDAFQEMARSMQRHS